MLMHTCLTLTQSCFQAFISTSAKCRVRPGNTCIGKFSPLMLEGRKMTALGEIRTVATIVLNWQEHIKMTVHSFKFL